MSNHTMSTSGSSHTTSPLMREYKSVERTDDVADDQKSMMSQESGIPRADGALHALQHVSGKRVRHGRCAPEFLEEMAANGANDGLRRFVPKKFKVISGQEARTFFRSYISEHTQRTADKRRSEITPSPIVFAITAWEGSTRCVDYYMTWRGIKRTHLKQETERKVDFLDSEFRRLAKRLDEEYQRIASLTTHEQLTPVKREFGNVSDSSVISHSRPPPKPVSEPAKTKGESLIPGLPNPPLSANDSVMSLPLLNMVRNVPFSHRVPLRVTNPDRLSMISNVDKLKPWTEPKTSLDESQNSTGNPVLPNVLKTSKYLNAESPTSSPVNVFPKTRSGTSRLSRSNSFSRAENRSSSVERIPEQKRSFTDDDLPEFLIVFLGDKPNMDPTSWHGLERQSSIRSLPPDRHSPWIGPLARSDSIGQRYSVNFMSQEGGDDPESWMKTPVVPMKPLLEAMGYVNPYYQPMPVVPGAQYMSLSQMGSPAPNESSYLYFSPQTEASPYIPWPLPMPPNNPLSRPSSQAYSTAHSSPFMHPHATPF